MRALIAAKRPEFMGALYTLKAASLKVMPQVLQRKGWKHRLVTFDQTGEAMLTAAGYPPGGFQKIIGEMRESAARRTASGDAFLIALRKGLKVLAGRAKDAHEPTLRQVLQRSPATAIFDAFGGTAAVMRPNVLMGLLPRTDSWEKDPAIPGSERALLDALRRVQPMLSGIGITYREIEYGTRTLARFEWAPGVLDDE